MNDSFKEPPFVSIIIPCYNSENYIKQSILSAINQTYKNIEIIVVDDGSKDESIKVIEKFSQNIKIIKQNNLGGGAARNRGLQEATGKYIKFLDADDVLYLNAIEEQIKLQQGLNEDIIIYGEVDFINENNEVIKKNTQPKFDLDNQLATLIEKAIITSAPLYRRVDLIELGGFKTSLTGNQEHELNLRLALKGKKFLFYPTQVYMHRHHESEFRISKRNWCVNNPTFALELLDHYERLLSAHNVRISTKIKDAMAHRHIGAGRGLLRAGNLAIANEHFRKANELMNGDNFRIGNRSRSFTKYYMGLSKIIGLRNTEMIYFATTKANLFKIG